MPIWHQSPKLTPRYFLETPRLFGYPKSERNLYYPNFLRMLSNCVIVISSFSV